MSYTSYSLNIERSYKALYIHIFTSSFNTVPNLHNVVNCMATIESSSPMVKVKPVILLSYVDTIDYEMKCLAISTCF